MKIKDKKTNYEIGKKRMICRYFWIIFKDERIIEDQVTFVYISYWKY